MPGKLAGVKAAKIKLKKRREPEEEKSDDPSSRDAEESECCQPEQRRKSGGQNAHFRMLKSLAPIIEGAQHKSNSLDHLLKSALDVYKEGDNKVFTEVLWRMMIVPFQVKDKQENIERVIKFFLDLIPFIMKYEYENTQETGLNDSDLNESQLKKSTFSHRMLRLCEKYHDESRPQIRMRIIQTVVRICESFQTMDEVDESLKKKIAHVLLTRLKDKNHLVRCAAAKGLCYFQGGQGCPITRKMMESIRIDPRPEVRRDLVLSIVLDSDDYGDFLDRVVDIHPEVRRACVRQIREIALSSIPTDEREQIVYCGMNDVSSAVRDETVKLVHHWFRVCSEDPLKMLNEFDMYNNSKLCLRILNILFDEITEENWNVLSKDLLVDKFLPLDCVSETKMFLWWFLFYKFSSEPFYAEKLFPELTDITAYCSQLIRKLETEHFDDEERARIMGLFLKIVLYIPAEEGGRIQLDKIARIAFKFQHKSLLQMKLLVLMIHKAHPNGCDDILLEIIRDMVESLSVGPKPVNEVLNQENREEKLRQLKLKLSSILHKKHGLRKEKEQLIQNNNFLEAHAVQEQLKEVEEEVNAARLEMQNYENEINSNGLEGDNEDQQQEPQPCSSEALFYAFAIFLTHLKLVTKISQYLRNFFHAEVVKSIFREENELRMFVFQIMTQVGFFDLEDACTAMVVCLQGLLNEEGEVKHVALQCVFDLLLKYGFESFEETRILSVFSQVSLLSGELLTVEKMLINLLTSFVRTGNEELTQHIAVVGMLKLLIMGRLKSPKIVATLLTFWANSANEGTKLYHDIGVGLSLYVQQSSEKAEIVARALVPSVGKVINSSSSSSFRKVDPEKLMGFITMQTDQAKLTNISKPHMPHEIIAFDVVEEIRKRPLCVDNSVFVKALKGLSLQGISRESLTDLKSKLKHILKEEVRSVRQSVTAFGKYLDDLDPEVRAMALMSDPNSSSDEEPEEQDKTDMFQSMNTTVVSTDGGRSMLCRSKAPAPSAMRTDDNESEGTADKESEENEEDDDDTLVAESTLATNISAPAGRPKQSKGKKR